MRTTYSTKSKTPQDASYTNPLPVFPLGAGTAIAPSTASVANTTDTSISFSSAYHRLMLQNNSTTTLYYAFDQTAGTGTFQLAPTLTIIIDTSSTLHLYQASGGSLNINGANGFALQAWTTPSV